MTDDKPLDLPALRELCEKATPEPWRLDSHAVTCGHETIEFKNYLYADTAFLANLSGLDRKPDAEFIAAARTAVPKLIEEVQKWKGLYQDLERRYMPLEQDKLDAQREKHNYRQENTALKAIIEAHPDATDYVELQKENAALKEQLAGHIIQTKSALKEENQALRELLGEILDAHILLVWPELEKRIEAVLGEK